MMKNFDKFATVIMIFVISSLTNCMENNKNKPDKKLPDNIIEKYNKYEQEKYKNSDTISPKPTKILEVGDKIELFGGYYDEPLYLQKPPSSKRTGLVTKFIESQNEGFAAVIKLDKKISGDTLTGNFLVLQLRYKDQSWFTTGPVHIELCDTEPENKTWRDRQKGEWIEAAASFRIIN